MSMTLYLIAIDSDQHEPRRGRQEMSWIPTSLLNATVTASSNVAGVVKLDLGFELLTDVMKQGWLCRNDRASLAAPSVQSFLLRATSLKVCCGKHELRRVSLTGASPAGIGTSQSVHVQV